MQIKSDLDNSEKRLVRMANAYGDMHLADQAYKQYCQCSNEGINYCLLLAMVTCYCRPFTMNEGLGGLYSDYATFPDFSDNKLNEGHFFFIALRNQFFAHSSIAGIKIQLVPPSVMNPETQVSLDRWDVNLAKRFFHHSEYRMYIVNAYPVIPALIKKLQNDIYQIAPSIGALYKDMKVPFELDTGAENFDLKREMEILRKKAASRKAHGPGVSKH